MIYLIQMGLEEGLSFTIMKSVRKDKAGIKGRRDDKAWSASWYIWYIKD